MFKSTIMFSKIFTDQVNKVMKIIDPNRPACAGSPWVSESCVFGSGTVHSPQLSNHWAIRHSDHVNTVINTFGSGYVMTGLLPELNESCASQLR